MTEKAKNLIKKFEGLRFSPYLDSAGVVTIGYGHALQKINIEQAEKWLIEDIRIAEYEIEKMQVALNKNQEAALVSLIFNIGVNAFEKSTLRSLIVNSRFDRAADEILKWRFVHGVEIRGLALRRAEEKKIFESVENE